MFVGKCSYPIGKGWRKVILGKRCSKPRHVRLDETFFAGRTNPTQGVWLHTAVDFYQHAGLKVVLDQTTLKPLRIARKKGVCFVAI